MTKKRGADARVITAGIRALLADDRRGRRSIRWLSEQSGISRSSLTRKLATGRFLGYELFGIADALEVDVRDIYTAGLAALEEEQAA